MKKLLAMVLAAVMVLSLCSCATAEETVALRVRRMIAGSSEQEGISMVLSMMDRTKDNEDFVARFDQWAKMMGNGGARQ